jgi:hypothetical protein
MLFTLVIAVPSELNHRPLLVNNGREGPVMVLSVRLGDFDPPFKI